ncbi:hypothetical protein HSISB1_319 [Streptococcus sp. HSISB1]|nr:hypothetical protein HSISB1_319 [Streptococcus sp. HSISB1]
MNVRSFMVNYPHHIIRKQAAPASKKVKNQQLILLTVG